MSRYINADNAVSVLGEYLMTDAQIEYGGSASEDIEDWKELASDILNGTPSIDIVRCKECKYWREYETWSECERWTGDPYDTAKTNADDFCSYGCRDSEKPNNSERSSE